MKKNRYEVTPIIFSRLFRISILGVLSIVLGIFLSDRVWMNILLAANYLTDIAFCGMFFVAILYVSNAGWGTVIRRVPEAMFSVLGAGFILMLVSVIGSHYLYEWTHIEVVKNDVILSGKQAWLNLPSFVLRISIYFGIWYFLGRPILRHSRMQDSTGNIEHTQKAIKWSAAWLYLGGIAFVASSFDWIMSIEPHWFSTIFGLYKFSGMFTVGLAFMIMVLIYLRRVGALKLLKDDHLHELGRYLFAFTTFWIYIWFSQHMLIWYANIPEETSYYLKRHSGPFLVLSVVNIFLNWLIPFTILLFRKTKRSEKSLIMASIAVLIGHWLDLYLMIFPPLIGNNPEFGFIELGVSIIIIVISFGLVILTISKGNVVPIKDPYINESIRLHT